VLTEEVQGLRDEVTDLKRTNDDLFNENDQLKERIDSLERSTDDLEGRSRRNNLLFFGMDRREGETGEDLEGRVQDLLTDKLEVGEDVSFDRVHRLGSGNKAPVIARCTFFKQKVAILKAKAKLQNQNCGISIAEDFTQRVRDVRKRLLPHLKRAKEEGKRATLIYDHLLIDGKKYGLGEGDCLLDFS
jgi:predicted nuclease with TOPRIM domain